MYPNNFSQGIMCSSAFVNGYIKLEAVENVGKQNKKIKGMFFM